MRAIVRQVSSSFEKALAKYFGSGPTDLNEAIRQHEAYVSKIYVYVVMCHYLCLYVDSLRKL